MAQEPNARLKHFLLQGLAESERYSAESKPVKFPLPQRDRLKHGEHLQKQLEQIARDLKSRPAPEKPPYLPGFYIEVESEFGFDLKTDRLSFGSRKIKLVSLKTETTSKQTDKSSPISRQVAGVFIQEGKLSSLEKKVDDYINEYTNPRPRKDGKPPGPPKPQNQPLVESISNIRSATLKTLWTEAAPFPDTEASIWWEVWLQAGESKQKRQKIIQLFRETADSLGLPVSSKAIEFLDATVLLIKATRKQLTDSILPLNILAEIRKPRETAEFFTSLSNIDQNHWAEDLLSRIVEPGPNVPAVCILDNGVNNGHPLLKNALRDSDLHAYDPNWGGAADFGPDVKGHGTWMAGLALYGDLVDVLETKSPVRLSHRLESVKILPPRGANEPSLYGEITVESMARPEVEAPSRNRVFSMAVTAKTPETDPNFCTRGKPSSWSGAIDQACSDALEDESRKHRRLIVISAGNANYGKTGYAYPNSNLTEEVKDPGQCWNGITIGAFTEKVQFTPNHPDSTLIAPFGGLSPSSSTSVTFSNGAPIKPEVVCEGGNLANISGCIDRSDPLQLLTTNHLFQRNLFTTAGETSAATALAARTCARIWAERPEFWPETIRGLLIHSAEWTPEMLGHRDISSLKKSELRTILRSCGYGVPSFERAAFSARNSVTLIAQDEIQPYKKEVGKGGPKINEINLYRLPWPSEVLGGVLAHEIVEMKVTLSYFIEPKPESASQSKLAGYASHHLQFEVKDATETTVQFRKRINKAARDEDEKSGGPSPDNQNWRIGPSLRNQGSIHSDTWVGTGAQLAEKGEIAVHPLGGWWKTALKHRKYNSRTRYSLIVTISTPKTEVDIYTPVQNQIATLIPTPVEVEVGSGR